MAQGVSVSEVVLAVDFGSSSTAAAYRDADGRVHELRLSSTGALMPSAVLWSGDRIVVGRSAAQAMLTNPEGFEPSPKRRLADREILLGDAFVPVSDLVTAVLREVLARATQVLGRSPDRVVLTHPDKWGTGLQQQLATAAERAGVARDRIGLVSEATAAAQFYTATGAALPVGARVVVFDFGAGTADVAVLDKQVDGSFSVVAADGEEGVGGHDLDARIDAWVRRQVAADDPVLAAELNDPAHLATRLTLNDRIRDAKEALSELPTAAIVVTGVAGTRVVQLTRGEFDGLIGADVNRAVDLTRRVLAEANRIRPTNTAPTIYLAGGSSAIPLVHTRLAELGSIAVLGDPKTVVCQGALYTPAAPRTQRAPVLVETNLPTMQRLREAQSQSDPASVEMPSPLSQTHSTQRRGSTRTALGADVSQDENRARRRRSLIGVVGLGITAGVFVVRGFNEVFLTISLLGLIFTLIGLIWLALRA